LSPEQIAVVLTKLEGHALYPIVALALATRMRRGELLALQWGDIDLDSATLGVERSVEETKAGLRLKSPKTKRGRRNVTLPPEAVAMLRAHKVTFKGGDTLQESFEEGSHLKEYTYKYTGGTGKYKGATGGGTYTSENLTDTTAWGRYKGTIVLP
jgi:integrase